MQTAYVDVFYSILVGFDGPEFKKQIWARTSTNVRRGIDLDLLLVQLQDREKMGDVKTINIRNSGTGEAN